VLHREASSAVAIYSFGTQKTIFISGFIGRTVIDITQLGCPELPDISLPAISYTFTCHKSKHVCIANSLFISSVAQLLLLTFLLLPT